MCWHLTKVPLIEVYSIMFQGLLQVRVYDTSQSLSSVGMFFLYFREWKILLSFQNGSCNIYLKHL